MTRTRMLIAGIVAIAAAGFALGQNADKNTAGPTKNDYRLRVVEPAEGATITKSPIQVVVDLRTIPEVGGETRDVNSMPRPRIDVFLDNDNKGTLQEGSNVLTLDAVTPGAHKLVVLAKNQSGEVIDRKEVNFTAEPATSVATSASSRLDPAIASRRRRSKPTALRPRRECRPRPRRPLRLRRRAPRSPRRRRRRRAPRWSRLRLPRRWRTRRFRRQRAICR